MDAKQELELLRRWRAGDAQAGGQLSTMYQRQKQSTEAEKDWVTTASPDEITGRISDITARQEVSDPLGDYARERTTGQAAMDALKYAGKNYAAGITQLLGGEAEDPMTPEYAAVRGHRPIMTGLIEGIPQIMAEMAGGRALRTAGALKNVGAQGVIGAGMGGAQYAEDAEDRAVNALTGGAQGAGGEVAGRFLSRLAGIRPVNDRMQGMNPDQARVIQAAEEAGGAVLPSTYNASGQRSKQVVEGGLASMLPTGRMADKVDDINQAHLNRTAAQSVGSDAPQLNATEFKRQRKRLNSEFNRLMDDTPVEVLDSQLDSLLDITQNRIKNHLVGPDDPVGGLMERTGHMLERAQTGDVTRREIQQHSSDLWKAAKSAMRDRPEMAIALRDVRTNLLDIARNNMDEADTAAFNRAREQWRNLRNMRDSKALDTTSGDVSGPKLSNFLNRVDQYGYFEGGEQSPLYEATRFWGSAQKPLGTSGTAERSALGNMIGRAGTFMPVAAGGAGLTGHLDPMQAAYTAASTVGVPYLLGRAYFNPAIMAGNQTIAGNPILNRIWNTPQGRAAARDVMRGVGMVGANVVESLIE